MTALQLLRALLAIGAAALCLGAGYAVSHMVDGSPAPTPDSQRLVSEGYDLFDSGDFIQSEQKFQAATRVFPQSGESWFMMGMARHYAKDYDGARANFQKALEFEYRPGLSHFNIGCGYSLQGNKKQAVAELQLAVKAGLTLQSHFATDPDLKNLHDDPDFKALLASLQHPLSDFPEAVAMERRIGSWDVFDRDNHYLGTVRSDMTLNGFGIEEHLISAAGLSEQSLFLFNEKEKSWTCTIADGEGAIGLLKGNIKNGRLQVSGPMSGTGTGLARITIEFTPEGLMRETHEAAPAAGSPFVVTDVRTFKPSQS